MIIEMKQIHSPAQGANAGIEYVFFKKDEQIGTFSAKNPPTIPLQFEGEYKGENNYKIILEKNDTCPDGYKEGMLTYKFKTEDGTKIGINKYEYNYYNEKKENVGKLKFIGVSPKREKIFAMPKTYQYQEFTFKGEKYEMYDVRVRGTGVFYCIYKENHLVAMAERYLKVVNWLDNYTIYSLDDIDAEFLCLATAYYDYSFFEQQRMPQGQTYNVETGDSTIEYREDILNKYDPNFKWRIIEMENKRS